MLWLEVPSLQVAAAAPKTGRPPGAAHWREGAAKQHGNANSRGWGWEGPAGHCVCSLGSLRRWLGTLPLHPHPSPHLADHQDERNHDKGDHGEAPGSGKHENQHHGSLA